jgi:hypothetical protein
MERSEEFGQTSSQMSEIAREARGLAEKWVTRHLNKSIFFCAILHHFFIHSLSVLMLFVCSCFCSKYEASTQILSVQNIVEVYGPFQEL